MFSSYIVNTCVSDRNIGLTTTMIIDSELNESNKSIVIESKTQHGTVHVPTIGIYQYTFLRKKSPEQQQFDLI
jgi:hypothetical protein